MAVRKAKKKTSKKTAKTKKTFNKTAIISKQRNNQYIEYLAAARMSFDRKA